MDTIRTEHEINELKLQSLKAEVEKAVSPEPQAGGSHASTSAGTAAGRGVNIPIMDGAQATSISNNDSISSTTKPPSSSSSAPKPSRSPVDLASQLFSRNKGKSSKSKNKKGSASPASKGRTPPNGVAASPNNAANIDSLKSEIAKTQENEMKLVSAAVGINPDGQPLAEEGHDDVLDLADQLLAQLDAKQNESVSSQTQAPAPASTVYQSAAPTGIASGTASASHNAQAPLAAPQPINIADANLSAQSLNAQAPNAANNNNAFDGSSSLAPASSRQSINSSSSAISTASTTIPPATSSRSRHSSSSSAPKSSSFGAKLKQALSPNSHRDDPSPVNIAEGDSPVDGSTSVPTQTSSTSPFSAQTFKNRHALRKEKKKQKEDAMRAEAQAEVEAERANGGAGDRYDAADLERQGIESICRSWNLELVEMEPDGHCMYSAIADQLTSKKIIVDKEKKMSKKERKEEKWDYGIVRKVAADYMRKHMDDFLPYLPAEDVEGQGEGLLTPEGYMKHCDNVENTSEWGSQTELLALSKALELPIWVIQSRSPTVKIGTEEPYAKKKSPLMVTYHRVQYGLGEHYNSARVLPRESGMVYLG